MVSATLLRWIHENRKSIAIGILIVLVLLCWIRYDADRNTDTYDNTNDTVERLEKRIDDAGKRIESISTGVSKTEETIGRTADAVGKSRESAEAITDGIAECEARLDRITQRQGRIKNIIADIERTNQ